VQGGNGVSGISMSAAVGLLTRNIRIVGADINALTPNFGASLVSPSPARCRRVLTVCAFHMAWQAPRSL
jgi:hypothetical protein